MSTRLLRRIAYWLRLSVRHTEMLEELAFHREMIERELIRRGMSPAAASEQARRRMGNEIFMREEARAVWVGPAVDALWQDATYALRGLRRNPVFTIGVILTLALGIGANAAMFSLVDRLLFRPPPLMVDAETVHRVYLYRSVQGRERETGGVYARYTDLAKWSTSSSQAAAVALRSLAVGLGDGTRVANVAIVSANFFNFFDAPPVLGRYFTAREDVPPSPAPIAVLSHTAWENRFASRRDVIGTTLHIDAVAYTIVGVAPPGFVGLWPYRPPEAFIPVAAFAASRGRRDWATTYGTAFGLGIIVRRKPGVTGTAANADLSSALRRSYQVQIDADPEHPPLTVLRPRAVAASVLTERGPEPSSVKNAALWLSGVTVIVLLIACANVANLLLTRAIGRRREIAVRQALGISRARLFAQLLTEGLLLAALGGAVGLLIATWGSRVLRATLLPDSQQVSLITDPRTLLFAGAVALGVGVLIGLPSMAQAARTQVATDLKSGVREGTYQRKRLRTALLVVQCALSVILLVGAGLFVQSLRNVRAVRLGFDADSVLVVLLNMRDVKLDSAATVALRLRLLESAQTLRGVTHATLQESIPFAGSSSWAIFLAGIDSAEKLGEFHVNTVSADYFNTMGTRIVRGRAIQSSDDESAPRVAVVGQSMAATLWPGQDPLGRCFRVAADTMPCTYVVGVAEDIHSQSLEEESRLYFYYLPAAQWRPQDGGLFVRAGRGTSGITEPLRRQLQREMPGAAFVTVRPLSDIVGVTMRSWIVGAKVFTGFGILALLLAAVGLYSVIGYNVTQRKHELGVRLALGASRRRVLRLVVMDGLRFALGGIVIGSVIASVAGRWIGPLLFRQSPRDATVFMLVTAVVLVVAVIASWIPALRAAGVDPKTALQAD